MSRLQISKEGSEDSEQKDTPWA